MSIHEATVEWRRLTPDFNYATYDRGHWLSFGEDIRIPGTAARANIPPTASSSPGIDPEQTFVAALASCHMLWFLHLATTRKLVVDRYVDRASGVLEKNEKGQLAITQVTLKPSVSFGGTQPSEADVRALHERAHEECFIANSVKSVIAIEPEFD